MSATAEGANTERVPAWRSIACEQFRTVGAILRSEFRAAAAVLAALSAILLAFAWGKEAPTHFYMNSYLTAPIVLAGFAAALGTWRGDEPANRAYFWCMPVERMRHSLLKISAGWIWMMIAVALYLAWAVAIAGLTNGNIARSPQSVLIIADPLVSAAPVTPLRVVDITLGQRPWLWLAPFVASSVTYLAGSCFAIASDHSWRWLAGVGIGLTVFAGLEEEVRSIRILETLAFGRHGFLRLCILEAPSAGSWIATAALWLLPALAGAVVVAWRQREGRGPRGLSEIQSS